MNEDLIPDIVARVARIEGKLDQVLEELERRVKIPAARRLWEDVLELEVPDTSAPMLVRRAYETVRYSIGEEELAAITRIEDLRAYRCIGHATIHALHRWHDNPDEERLR